MSYTVFTTHDLLQMVRVLRDPEPFWLTNFFKAQHNSDSQWIDFDVVDEGRRLAPFVVPTAQGAPVGKDVFDGKRFRPAYIKPKGFIEPSQLVERVAGEQLTGSYSMAQRRDILLSNMIRKFRNQIVRRWEWMAAQAALYSSVTISGPNYPTTTISFGRDNSLTSVLTGTDAWTNAASTPLADLEEMIGIMRDLSGYGVESVIMGTSAWSAFAKHADVKALLETRRGSTSTAEVGPGTGKPFVYKGQFGDIGVWVYSDKYENDSGVQTNFMDPRDVVGIAADGFQGVRCFGAIMDADAGYGQVDIFPKMWREQDPSFEVLLMQSAPLMVPKQPNASFRIRAVE